MERTTSSWSLVSSRASTADRSLPHAAASSESVPATRPPDSKITTVSAEAATVPIRRFRSPARRGRKPSNRNRSVGNAETMSAAIAADGPGMASTGTPAVTQAATSRSPGSEMAGVPASLT